MPATLRSVEKARTGTPRSRAIGATADTEGPNRGPTMISAPWPSNLAAAAPATSGVAPSSAAISKRLPLPESNSASSAAFNIAAARFRVAALVLEKGRITPTLTGVAPGSDIGQPQIIGGIVIQRVAGHRRGRDDNHRRRGRFRRLAGGEPRYRGKTCNGKKAGKGVFVPE